MIKKLSENFRKSTMADKFHFVEMFGLIALVFSLPIMESPKHFAFAIFVIGTLGKRLTSGNFRWRKPDFIETILICMGIVALVATILNWPTVYGTRGLRNNLILYFLFWALYRNTYTENEIKLIICVLVSSTIIGLGIGFWQWGVGRRAVLQFHSAGVVTQSSIYLGVTIFIMFGLFIDSVSGITKKIRIITGICTIISLCCVIIMGSRGGIFAVLLSFGLITVFLFHARKYRYYMAIIGIAIAIISGIILITNQSAAERMKHLMYNFDKNAYAPGEKFTESDTDRFNHWKIGVAQITQGGKIFFGIGPRNSEAIDTSKLKFDKILPDYFYGDGGIHHAHNLFLTKWCEEGLIGLLLFILFFGYIFYKLISYRPRRGQVHWAWITGTGALTVPIVGGFFNSAFTNEFAWLAMILMGIFVYYSENKFPALIEDKN